MKPTPKSTPRSAQIRAWWHDHISAQQASGQSQVGYCCERNLNPKDFYLWKSKLSKELRPTTSPLEVPTLIPVSIKTGSDSNPKPGLQRLRAQSHLAQRDRHRRRRCDF